MTGRTLVEIDAFLSFTIAILLLLTGKALTLYSASLRKYSIPEPVVGGLLCAFAVGLIHLVFDQQVKFELEVRNFFLLLFFAGIGLKSDISALRSGGKPLLALLLLASAFMVAQNFVGITVASAFGMDPLAGLMAGSISLTGGFGTTFAWSPVFTNDLRIANAMELGVASSTIGLIAACVIGGPIATFLMRRHQVESSGIADLEIGVAYNSPTSMDYFSVLWAILSLNLAVMLGLGLNELVQQTGVTLPAFVSCLVAGIFIRNLRPQKLAEHIREVSPGVGQALSLISDLALGLFLTMALIDLQIGVLTSSFGFIFTVLAAQIIFAIGYTVFIVFRVMGADYEAAVMSAGFGGIALGSTATAIANMTAVTQQHGAAHRAFLILPLVCGFFIDIVNALVISMFIQ